MAWAERSGKNLWRVRYRRDDGTIGQVTGFRTQREAQDYADDLESDQRKGTFIDPAAGQITVADWAADWVEALDVDPRTEDNYRSMLRNHILPRWGTTPLADVTALKVHAWAKKLRADGLAPITVAGIIKLLAMIFADAVEDRRLPANPIRARRRGRRRHTTPVVEKIWAEPEPVLHLADQIATAYHPHGALLVITAAYTGARWGELTALQQHNVHLYDDDTGHIIIDPEHGALHESNDGRLWLGPPKTLASARQITLPPFLVRLMRAHLDTHQHRHMFTTPDGDLHRRSNFARRALRPAADGTLHTTNPAIRQHPAAPGLTFHGLRHSHKTWMIADGIPEIAQALRLGHVLKDKIQQTYSHVAAEVDHRLLTALQDRWNKAIANTTHTGADTTWRDPA